MTRLLAASFSALILAGCFTQPPAPSVDRVPTAASKASAAPAASPVPSGPGYYTVKKGDTLYRIALEHGQDYRDIAGWSNLGNPDSIKEGQVLRVAPPSVAEPANGAVVAKPIATASAVEARPLDKNGTAAVAPVVNDGVKREPKVNKEPYSPEAHARLSGTAAEAAPRPQEAKVEPPKPEAVPVAASNGPDDISWGWPSAGKVMASYSESTNKGLDIGGKAGDPVLAAGDGRVVYAGSGLRGYGQLVIVKHNNSFLSAYAHNQKILVKEKQEVTRGQKIAEMGDTDSDKVKLHFEIRRQGKPIDPLIYLPKR